MKLIILDRDGVINQDPTGYISKPEDWHPYPGSLSAIAKLNQAGFWVTIASNQSGIGRGFFSESALTLVHQKMIDELAKVGGHLDGIFYCPHQPDDHCHCRKPNIGLLEQMQKQFHVTPEDMLFIGDSLVDLQTADRFGCHKQLVLTGNGKKTLRDYPQYATITAHEDLLAAVHALLKGKT